MEHSPAMSAQFRKFLLWLWPTIQRLYLRFGILVLRPEQRPLPSKTTHRDRLDRKVADEIASHVGGAHAHNLHRGSKVPGGHSHLLLLVLLVATVTHAQTLTDKDYAKALNRRDRLKTTFDRDQARYVRRHQKQIDEYQGLVDRIALFERQHAPPAPTAAHDPQKKDESNPEAK